MDENNTLNNENMPSENLNEKNLEEVLPTEVNDSNVLEQPEEELTDSEKIENEIIDEVIIDAETEDAIEESQLIVEEEAVKETNITQTKTKKKKKKREKKHNYSIWGGIVLSTILLSISIITVTFICVVGLDVLGLGEQTNKITIYIPENSTPDSIGKILKDEGIIEHPFLFSAVVKLKNAGGSLYPGNIEVSSNMSYADIIDLLTEIREKRESVTITFPEGITLFEAAKKIEEAGVCLAEDFIWSFNNVSFGHTFEGMVQSSPLKFYKMEGFMFPETYDFYLNDTPYNVVKRIRDVFDDRFTSEHIARMEEMGFTIDQLITLASIVQAEAGDIDEMKMVASVFINRLNNPNDFPRLQSDTTDNYVENVIKPNIDIDNQEMYDAYDTYVGFGLPPGAICNPGMDAIEAVLYPENTEYFYFCSNINTREFFYAKTYSEHQANLKKAGLA